MFNNSNDGFPGSLYRAAKDQPACYRGCISKNGLLQPNNMPEDLFSQTENPRTGMILGLRNILQPSH